MTEEEVEERRDALVRVEAILKPGFGMSSVRAGLNKEIDEIDREEE